MSYDLVTVGFKENLYCKVMKKFVLTNCDDVPNLSRSPSTPPEAKEKSIVFTVLLKFQKLFGILFSRLQSFSVPIQGYFLLSEKNNKISPNRCCSFQFSVFKHLSYPRKKCLLVYSVLCDVLYIQIYPRNGALKCFVMNSR